MFVPVARLAGSFALASNFELFRFAVARSPLLPKLSILLSIPDPIPELAAKLMATNSGPEGFLRVVDGFLEGNPALQNVHHWRIGEGVVLDLAPALASLPKLTLMTANQTITSVLGKSAAEIADSNEFGELKRQAYNALVAFKARQMSSSFRPDTVICATGYRTGRSIGIAYLESPELKHGDKTILQAGMTFAVDGGISVDGRLGGRIGDSVVVTATGTEYITEYPREILTVNR